MNQHKAPVAIVGLGYVGLPLAELFINGGWEVYGVDIDQSKIDSLLQHKSYLSDYKDEAIAELFEHGSFHPCTAFDVISQVKTVILCIPTPLTPEHQPDLHFLKSALSNCIPHLQQDQLIVLESSTYPGTTEEVICPVIKFSGYTIGEDFFIAYSPERIDPGNTSYQLNEIPKLVGGVTKECTERASEVYETIFDSVVSVSSPKVAEMSKLVENSQRLINISFMNELLLLCEKMDISLWEVIDAASTKPFGFTPYFPGPGIGGHCIPVDPMYLLWKAGTYQIDLDLIKWAHQVNERMPYYIVNKIEEHSEGHSLNGKKILVIGTAYKKNVNDVRESSALKIMKLLQDKGADVHYYDPYIPSIKLNACTLKSVELTPETIAEANLTLIHTDHSSLDYEKIVQFSNLVLDTRRVTKANNNKKVILL